MLTNWDTIQNSIKRLKNLEEILINKTSSYTKKELLKFEKMVEKLNKALGGIKNMNGKPDLLFIIDTNKEILAVQEANKIGIPIVAVIDSNSNHELAPEYDWIEVNDIGTNLNLTDDSHTIIPIDFDFRFYGEDYNEITIGSNGWASFLPCLNGDDSVPDCEVIDHFFNNSITITFQRKA